MKFTPFFSAKTSGKFRISRLCFLTSSQSKERLKSLSGCMPMLILGMRFLKTSRALFVHSSHFVELALITSRAKISKNSCSELAENRSIFTVL